MNRQKPGAPSVILELPDLLAVLDRAQHPAPASLLAQVDELMAQAETLGLALSPVQAVLAIQARSAAFDGDDVSQDVTKDAPSTTPRLPSRPWWQSAVSAVLGLMTLGCLAGFGSTVIHAHAQIMAGHMVDLKALNDTIGIWILSSVISALGAGTLWHVRQLAEGSFFMWDEAEEVLGVGPWIRVK